jgi:hypothetical protein
MMNGLFVALLAIACLALFAWGVRVLPGERWQVAAAVPVAREGSGWRGVNLTWYGILCANAYLTAVMVMLVLLGSVEVPLAGTLTVVVMLLAVCVPASSIVARLVEKKRNTLTVGGAVFVGMVVAPFIIAAVNRFTGFRVPTMATLAAIAVAYAFGEGLGRLACLSFGCCYGKRISACSPRLRRLLGPFAVIYSGDTKKVAYAGGMAGERLLPVQALTYLLYCGTGLAGVVLFLGSHHAAAFLLATTVTQGWRFASEFLRDDYRGGGRISAYQVMGLLAIVYAAGVASLTAAAPLPPADAAAGVAILWQPAMVLFLQALWVVIFLYTGKSSVTGATLSFHVHHDRV